MNIPDMCCSIEKELTRKLRQANDDVERQLFQYEALKDIGERVIPELNRLMTEKGEGSSELAQALAAALDLTAFVCIGFIRKCTNYSWGVTCLDEVAGICREPQLKKKLTSYTNQLKMYWNRAEPGGVAHNPRAKIIRTQTGKSTWQGNLLRITLLLGSATYFFTHIDLTSLVFPGWNEPREQAVSTQLQNDHQQEEVAVAPRDMPTESQIEVKSREPEPTLGRYYTFTDEQGVVHMVNDPNKVPPEFRAKMKVTNPGVSRVNTTPVTIRDNQVLVPVILSHRGRIVEARFLLDTGASVTAIGEQLAARLGVLASEVKEGRTTIADGRSIGSYSFLVDSLAVGTHSIHKTHVSIIPRSGNAEYDGLLGMNFLKNYRYHVDFNRSVIEWGG